MNCYYHPNKRAIKVCEVCEKPICIECYDTILNNVICKRCKLKVANKLHDTLSEEQSEQRVFSYALPVISFLVGISFLLVGFTLGSEMGSFNIFHILSLILVIIGVIGFLFVYFARKKGHYFKENRPTFKKKIGWIFVVLSILSWIVLPAAGLLVDISGFVILAIILLSFILLLTGAILAYGKK